MNSNYRIFGLNIASAITLPATPVHNSQPDALQDVTIDYGVTPDSLLNPLSKGVRFQASPGKFLLRVDGVARYYVENGNRITITPEDGAYEDDVLVFLMGSAIGALLHQRSILVLHAAAIAVSGGSIIFTGPSGIGKSTLAAGFHKRGYAFLADDVCAINTANEHPEVIPGFPQLKLWADCLKRLDADKATLRKIRWGGGLEKYFLPVDRFGENPVPVRSIFVLEETNTDLVEITPLKGAEKIESFMSNTYRRRFLEGLGGEEEHFKQCASVSVHAGVYRVLRPRRGPMFDDLVAKVEEKLFA